MNIVITGASSGVGFSMARHFGAVEGNRVVAIARREDRISRLKGSCPPGRIIPLVMDLQEPALTGLNESLDREGIHQIDILVHNAGHLIRKPMEEISLEDWQLVYHTNVFAPAMLTSALLGRLGQGQQPSHVVMISSIGGVSGTAKFPGLTAYSSSKGALGILAEVMAEEFREKNIRVNTIALGSVQTEMLEKAFPGFTANVGPDEAAGFICRFCMEGWRFCNGKTLQMSTGTP